ncbi:MAG TPA: hypothetical protein VLM38_19505 [Blastocatellia bacterium]|nr:hypothetical protein [Blastocatellia bacterium]
MPRRAAGFISPAALDSEPSWSPDGSLIAFRSDRDGDGEIYVMRIDIGNERRLTNNVANDMFPAWSSDGTRTGR